MTSADPMQASDGAWRELLGDAGLESGVLRVVDQKVLHRVVDTSAIALTRLFDLLDTEGTGRIDWPQFLQGVQRCFNSLNGGKTIDISSSLEPIWDAAATDDQMDCRTFVSVIRRLKLEVLLRACDNQASDAECGLQAFGFSRTEVHEYNTKEEDMRQFFFESLKKESRLHWVIADARDKLNVLRLACKYHIHCLYIEDMLKLNKQKPTFVKHANNYFIVLPVLRLSPQTDRDRQEWQAKQDEAATSLSHCYGIGLEEANAAVYLAGPPDHANNAVITVCTTWRRVRNKAGNEAWAYRAPIQSERSGERIQETTKPEVKASDSKGQERHAMRSRRSMSEISVWDNRPNLRGDNRREDKGQEDDLVFDQDMLVEVSDTVHNTDSSNSNISFWLVHAILDNTVDRLLPVVEAYQQRVRWYQEALHESDARFSKRRTKEVMNLKTDLVWLQQHAWLHRPVIKQLLRLVAGQGDLLTYFQDIDQHLDRCTEAISHLTALTQSLVDEAHVQRDDRINEILLVVTIITATFAPASFIAGVYGMNFKNDDGIATMPELNWSLGYLWFWVWALAVTGCVLLYLRIAFGFTFIKGTMQRWKA